MEPVTLTLPIADRRAALRFYEAAFGFEALGEPAADGVPEPLQFALGGEVRLRHVPRGCFDWVAAPHEVAGPGVSECLLALRAPDDGSVDGMVERARVAGATVVVPPGAQPWGYAGTVTDPDGHLWMITSAPRP